LELLKAERKTRDDIRIINMSRVFGQGPCLNAGITAARGDAVVYLDSDLQDPPEIIPKMIEAWRGDDEVEIVYTTRTERAGETFLKLWATNLGYRILKYTSDIDIALNSGDFRLLSRRATDEYLRLKERRPFFRFMVSWIGFKQKQVLYRREPRYAGKTKFPRGTRIITQFLEVALVPFSDLPLRLSLMIGFLASGLGLLYLLVVLVMKCMNLNLPGGTALMGVILLFGGIQLLLIGMQGLYIGAIHNEVKGRPHYIIRDTIGFQDRDRSPFPASGEDSAA